MTKSKLLLLVVLISSSTWAGNFTGKLKCQVNVASRTDTVGQDAQFSEPSKNVAHGDSQLVVVDLEEVSRSQYTTSITKTLILDILDAPTEFTISFIYRIRALGGADMIGVSFALDYSGPSGASAKASYMFPVRNYMDIRLEPKNGNIASILAHCFIDP